MTKNEWIEIRQQEQMPLSVFYNYYIDNVVGNKVDFEKFKTHFPRFIVKCMQRGEQASTNSGLKIVSMSNIIHKIYEYYDSKYDCQTESASTS